MIKTSDIYRSFRKLLESNFENIPVQIKDIKNPKPPCIYIKYIGGTDSQTADQYTTSNISFDIIYFSGDETLKDLLSVENVFKKIFKKPVKIEVLGNGNIEQTVYNEIDSISTSLDEDDYILHCMLSLAVNQLIPEAETNKYDEYDNNELMEELEI